MSESELLAELRDRLAGSETSLVAACVSIWLLGMVFFYFNRSPALKRFLLLLVIVVTHAIIGALFLSIPERFDRIWPMAVGVIVAAVFNWRSTRFCDSCGRTLFCQPIITPVRSCPHCDAEMK